MNVNNNLKILYLGLVICIINACSQQVISEQECKNTNWYKEGLIDGRAGKSARDLSLIIKACNEYKAPINQSSYYLGYNKGLQAYCSNERGAIIGVQGGNFPVVCMNKKFASMKTSWQQGIDNFCTHESGMLAGKDGLKANFNCDAIKHTTYFKGWNKGLRFFCNPSKAYQLGRVGKSIAVSCPVDLSVEFDVAYKKGYGLFKFESDLKRKIGVVEHDMKYTELNILTIDRQIRNLDNDIIRLKEDIRSVDCAKKAPSLYQYCMSTISSKKSNIEIKQKDRDYLEKQRIDKRYKISDLKNEKLVYESELRNLTLREYYS